MKKFGALLLSALMVLSLAACGSKPAEAPADKPAETKAEAAEESSNADLKIGYIFIGDENEGYTAAHYEGAKQMAATLGLSEDQLIIKWTTPEDESCYDAAVDLADQGCQIIFGNSFGHESYLMQAAEEFPEVQFCHATGYQAASSGLENMHNYFDSIYEARYVSGVVAGMKLAEMVANGEVTEAKVGYVGAYPYAEVISGFTSFFLGVRSVCPEATMEVKYTNSWASLDLEKECAEALIADGCVLISQHADTVGAPTACEAAGVPIVGYNIDMIPTAPTCALTSPTNTWGSYYTYAVSALLNGEAIATDWCQGFAEGAVDITPLNDAAVAEGTAEKVEEVKAAIIDGSLHVFDTATFTVNGAALTEADSDLVSDGYFHESEAASAPAFNFIIDGITAVEN